MTLALSKDTDRQNLLAGLRHSSLVRDDSGKHRVYRDEEEREYHSVTSILKHTAPAEQKAALMKWAKRPGSLEQRDMACSIGTAVHSYCEKILKRASILAINSANKRNGWHLTSKKPQSHNVVKFRKKGHSFRNRKGWQVI